MQWKSSVIKALNPLRRITDTPSFSIPIVKYLGTNERHVWKAKVKKQSSSSAHSLQITLSSNNMLLPLPIDFTMKLGFKYKDLKMTAATCTQKLLVQNCWEVNGAIDNLSLQTEVWEIRFVSTHILYMWKQFCVTKLKMLFLKNCMTNREPPIIYSAIPVNVLLCSGYKFVALYLCLQVNLNAFVICNFVN